MEMPRAIFVRDLLASAQNKNPAVMAGFFYQEVP
jgi:hypothetical protein